MFERDLESVFSIGSLCIIPFFIGQYTRISDKDFKWAYFLMFFMGIFCSYTHPGVALPLCLGFVTMAYNAKDVFFKRACWPMVVGFVIGTSALIYSVASEWTGNGNDSGFPQTNPVRTTYHILLLLWNTKTFIAGIGATVFCLTNKARRRVLQSVFVHNRLLCYCLLYALAIIPFAPLGPGFAVEGVCLFGMFWIMLIGNRFIKI